MKQQIAKHTCLALALIGILAARNTVARAVYAGLHGVEWVNLGGGGQFQAL